ncbi:MAG: phosphoenolpyruvate--protein phosphotransferase, partial [Lachnospiraceae bacterium]|nr:phosphoenolpyruvate--protein phosphotransferase [Lachnospiraceae bacterium]
MQQIKGNRLSDGIAIGKVRIAGADRGVGNSDNLTGKRISANGMGPSEAGGTAGDGSERDRLKAAFARAVTHQEELARKAAYSAGEEVAQIFRAHAVMLQDELLLGEILEVLEDRKCTAEEAVSEVLDAQAARYAGMPDPFLRDRGADFKDIRNCLLEILTGEAGNAFAGESVILAGEEITPSDLMRSVPGSILGIVTGKGGYESHTAILARGMGIPGIVVPDGMEGVTNGIEAVLDATEGTLIIEPDADTLKHLQEKQEAFRKEAENAAAQKAEPFVTAEGRTVRICANISGPADMAAVLRSGADGIGLFRTEMQYLGSTAAPDEEKQFESYLQVIEQMAPGPVILRTFDVGSDKCPDYLHLPVEDNPALGLRGIRLSLTMRDLFKTQLRAILRASAYANVGLLLPMVVSLREV